MDNGTYRARVISHALALSKTKQTPSVRVALMTKYNEASPSVPFEKRMYADLWLSDGCFDRTMHILTKTFGWSGEDLEDLNTYPELLKGAECSVVVENEEYNDNLIPKIKYVNDIQRKLDGNKARELSQSLSDKFAAYKGKSPDVGSVQTAIPGSTEQALPDPNKILDVDGVPLPF
jgi:hypothetical protein